MGVFSTQKPQPQLQPAPPKLHDALVFHQAMSEGSIITDEQLKAVKTPQYNANYIQDMRLAVGRRLNTSIQDGDYLTDTMLAPSQPVIDDLTPSHRAIAIRAGEVLTVGGYLQPGDHVDVMLLLKPNKESGAVTTARKIASNLKVLAVGEQQLGSQTENREQHAKSVVLSVQQALAPTLLLADSSGELRLAAVGSQELANEDNTDELTPGSLLHTVSLTTQSGVTGKANPAAELNSVAQLNPVAELKQFEPQGKATNKSSRPAAARTAPRAKYIEVIQGDERSLVQVPKK